MVRDEAHALPERQREHAPLGEGPLKRAGRPLGDLYVDDVRVDAGWVQPQARQAPDALSESAGAAVVIGQAGDHGLERHEPGRGQHTHLTHAATEHLAHAPGLFHERARAAEHRSGRAGQALAQAEGEAVGVGGDVSHRSSRGHRGVEHPGPVHVHRQASLVGN